MKRFAYSLLGMSVALAAGLSGGCQSPPAPGVHASSAPAEPSGAAAEAARRVYDSSGDFSMVPPAGYTRADGGAAHVLSFLGPGEPDFTVNINVNQCHDPGQASHQAAQQAKMFVKLLLRDYQVVEEGYGEIPGRQVYVLSGTFVWNGTRVRNLQYFVRGSQRRVYIVTFAAKADSFPAYRTVFEACAQTIEAR